LLLTNNNCSKCASQQQHNMSWLNNSRQAWRKAPSISPTFKDALPGVQYGAALFVAYVVYDKFRESAAARSQKKAMAADALAHADHAAGGDLGGGGEPTGGGGGHH
jgi:hypothetical protein